MEEYVEQEKNLIYALDIGTRSVVGVVGRMENERFKVLAIEIAEHGKRAMMDGQIDDIRQTAHLVRTVTDRLEERMKVRLRRVCVAAAGRALRTQPGSFTMELSGDEPIDAEQISQLETGAVSVAEEALQRDEDGRKQFFLVGYTVTQYCLDRYPLTTLQYHKGKQVEAHVVATFLPGEVIESLYATMRAAQLQVASLTLEPIASMNATIPADLRLLNLALVDIGAGTTDIAVCRDGSVVGYTMATVAGDEITEAIMRAYLVDFPTAEQMKRQLDQEVTIQFRDILGMEGSASPEEVAAAIQEPMKHLTEAIAEQIISLNGTAPSAVYMAGGGSKLNGLRPLVAQGLKMDERRVAIAGNNFAKSAFADEVDLENPEYATPLGIAISAGMGLLNDSYVVQLNGEPAKLFRNGVLTLRDILLMNGFTYSDMIGRTGKSLSITLDGKRVVLRGEPAVPAILQVNGEAASLSTIVHAGDVIHFVPAQHGPDIQKTLGELLKDGDASYALVNEQRVSMDTVLQSGDVVQTFQLAVKEIPNSGGSKAEAEEQPRSEVASHEEPAQVELPPIQKPVQNVSIMLNGKPLYLEPKENGLPYYVMDLLQYSGIDFEHLDRAVRLEVNGMECRFQQVIKNGDIVNIYCV